MSSCCCSLFPLLVLVLLRLEARPLSAAEAPVTTWLLLPRTIPSTSGHLLLKACILLLQLPKPSTRYPHFTCLQLLPVVLLLLLLPACPLLAPQGTVCLSGELKAAAESAAKELFS
jgi:hypothetical protein